MGYTVPVVAEFDLVAELCEPEILPPFALTSSEMEEALSLRRPSLSLDLVDTCGGRDDGHLGLVHSVVVYGAVAQLDVALLQKLASVII